MTKYLTVILLTLLWPCPRDTLFIINLFYLFNSFTVVKGFSVNFFLHIPHKKVYRDEVWWSRRKSVFMLMPYRLIPLKYRVLFCPIRFQFDYRMWQAYLQKSLNAVFILLKNKGMFPSINIDYLQYLENFPSRCG